MFFSALAFRLITPSSSQQRFGLRRQMQASPRAPLTSPHDDRPRLPPHAPRLLLLRGLAAGLPSEFSLPTLLLDDANDNDSNDVDDCGQGK